MDIPWRRGTLVTLSAMLLGAHCDICDEPHVAVGAADVDGGTVTWTKGTTTATQPMEGAFRPPDSEGVVCTAAATIGSTTPDGDGALDALYDDPRYSMTHTWLRMGCQANDQDDRNVALHVRMSDARDWAEGEVGLAELAPSSTAWAYEDCAADCTLCEATPVDGMLTVTVLSATGGRAELPAAVTDDFERVVRVDFDTGAPVVGTASGGSCDVPVAMSGSVTLRWNASHFRRVEGCEE